MSCPQNSPSISAGALAKSAAHTRIIASRRRFTPCGRVSHDSTSSQLSTPPASTAKTARSGEQTRWQTRRTTARSTRAPSGTSQASIRFGVESVSVKRSVSSAPCGAAASCASPPSMNA